MSRLANYRHRFFETGGGFRLAQPDYAVHTVFCGVPLAREVLGVQWLNRGGIRESIPPAHAEHIGRTALPHLAALALEVAA
ncbi:hypothetical protein [Streptomyces cyaneogriseus]|uniref:hypothetical protein n=1 Tax=Streptomyces cyaneogriseus TaxID=68192 RepID=UPI000AE25E57